MTKDDAFSCLIGVMFALALGLSAIAVLISFFALSKAHENHQPSNFTQPPEAIAPPIIVETAEINADTIAAPIAIQESLSDFSLACTRFSECLPKPNVMAVAITSACEGVNSLSGGLFSCFCLGVSSKAYTNCRSGSRASFISYMLATLLDMSCLSASVPVHLYTNHRT